MRISKMFVGEPAHESGLLFVGDHIVAVNGVQLHGKSHKEIVRQIQQAGNEVALSIQSAVDLDAVTPGEPVTEKIEGDEGDGWTAYSRPPALQLPLPSAPAEAHIHDLASLGVSYIAEGRFRDAIVAFSKV